ncbi:MAG: HlyD family efflux transporter periplasmic adaptor subunit [Candidatus Howiella sp.]|jgi:putative membrane fusion protein
MKKSYANILKAVLAIFIVSYLLMQVYNSLYNPFTTETATHYSTFEGVQFTGLSIRSETVLSGGGQGVQSFSAESGRRIAKDAVVVNLYSDAATASNAARLQEVESQLSTLKALQVSGTSADLITVETQIADAYTALLDSTYGHRFTSVGARSEALLALLNRRTVAIGQGSDFSSRIASLESEKASLEASGIRASGSVVTDTSGYFISEVDGYESILTPDGISGLTPEEIANLQPAATEESQVGKIVGDYEWYIACVTTAEEAARFTEGSALTLRTELASMPEFPATVERINKSADGKQAVLIFKSKYINGELAAIRTQPITAVLHSYDGLKISSSAVRVVDGQKGVYILSGSTVRFRKVEIIYTSGGYSVCRFDNTDSDMLGLYDEVIVKGKNLYDGKIVK